MCGILAVFYGTPKADLRARCLQLSKRIRHRGPDWTGIQTWGTGALAHERLSIIDLENGFQPLQSSCNPEIHCVVNGEIYNHQLLRSELSSHNFSTDSDSEVILHVYEEFGLDTPKHLDGDFTFVLFDGTHHLVARDPLGVVPLYRGFGDDGSIWYASEMKAIHDVCRTIEVFPPGCFYSSKVREIQPYYTPLWFDVDHAKQSVELSTLRDLLTKAVIKRLMSDVPYAVLLSGGLDSSLIASIASRHLRSKGQQLTSFSLGLKGSPDLAAAREVAEFLGTKHHEVIYTVQDGLDALEDVIYHIETVSCVRGAIPLYLLARRVKSLGFKKELIERLRKLNNLLLLRENKACLAWGLEVRVPFLDQDFLDAAMSVDPALKAFSPGGKIEKHLLRQVFDTPDDPYLPNHILWREKTQFSDGVGSDWVDGVRALAEGQVTDEMMANAALGFAEDTPTTKEKYMYRDLFERHFPNKLCQHTITPWIPLSHWAFDEDPSGRNRQKSVLSVSVAG